MRKKKNKLFICFSIIFSFLTLLIIHSIVWVQNEWSNIDFATIVFQLHTPLEGTNSEVVYEYLKSCLLKAVCETAFIQIVFILGRNILSKLNLAFEIKLFFKKNSFIFNLRKFKTVCYVFYGVLAVITVWKMNQISFFQYIKDVSTKSQIFEEHYENPDDVNILFPEQKRNLVLIYLESMEATYASIEEGGGKGVNYIPELTQLAKENISFSNTEKLGGAILTPGTEFTTGALLGTSSGVPFKSMVGGNSMQRYEEFLPGLVTIGDILLENGYKNYFLCGSEAEFGGRKLFFEKHGDYELHDYKYAKEVNYIPSDYYEFWGFEDKILFEIAKKELDEIGNSGEPFNYTMLTVDTHHPEGYICDICEIEYDEQYANVISCSSKQTAEFVSWIMQQPWYENTTVIILGDHLSMVGNFWDDIGDYNRTKYNCFLNVPHELSNQYTKNRLYSTLDYFPTILAAIGVEIEGERLGLGTNLFSAQKTLLEEMGEEQYSSELSKYSQYFVDHFEKTIGKE